MQKRYLLALAALIYLSLSAVMPVGAQNPTPERDLKGCVPKPGAIRFNGARPESVVLKDVDLLTQPLFGNDAKPITLVTIPKDSRVVVFDIDNVERKWYRVLWACDDFSYGGWILKDSVRYFVD